MFGTPPAAPAPALTAEDHFPRFRWVIISQMVLQQQLAPFMFSTLGILLPAMRAELGFGIIETGWLGAARTVGNLLVFPASIYLVRFQPIRMFNVFALVLAVALLISGLAPGFWFVLGGMVLYSFGASFGQIPANVIRQQWIPPREIATVAGAALSLQTILQITGLAIVPLILDAVGGWRTIFVANSVILVVIATAWFATARERITPSYAQARANDRGVAAARVVLRRREFYLLGLAVLGGATTFSTFLLFLPSYFVQDRGFSLQTAGGIVAVIPVGGLLVNGAAGYFSDRIGRRKPMIWPAGLVLPPLWLLLLMPVPVPVLLAAAIGAGGFGFLPFSALQTIPLEIPGLSPAERAIGQALQFTISTVGILLGPVVASNIVDATGSYRTGLLPLLLLPTLFVWTMLFLRETGPGARRRARIAT